MTASESNGLAAHASAGAYAAVEVYGDTGADLQTNYAILNPFTFY